MANFLPKPVVLLAVLLATSLLAYGLLRPAASPLPPALAKTLMQAPGLPQSPFSYVVKLPAHLRELVQVSTAPRDNAVSDHGAALGRVLFYDRALSKNGLVSCASCHSQALGFDDANRFSIGLTGKITARHSVGLAFAGYNANGRYFRDEHAATLEEQVLEPIRDPVEMRLTKGELVARVSARPWYGPLFQNAFGSNRISEQKIARALAQFVRSLVSINAPYDRARADVKNRIPAFTNLENTGKFLFMASRDEGGFGCSSCHEGEASIMLKRHNNGLDTVENTLAENTTLRGASLRNIAIRQPYMFDGRFTTLGQVIDHYSNGINAHPQLGDPLKDRNGEPMRFAIGPSDKAALIAFLETLTDRSFVKDQKFSNPFLRVPN